MPEERSTALAAIATEVRACTRCRLSAGRTNAVPGEGSPDTEVVFVGEGPGQHEDQQGRPFVGAAGGLLTELIGSIGWKRDEVFITNVVKCRPPGNRDPEADEMAACAPFLRRQLAVLDPALVVTLGRYSLGTFMPGARIGQVHGTQRPVDPVTGATAAVAFAMYHPAAAFRQLSLKETMREDMSRVPGALLEARAARSSRAVVDDLPLAPVAHPVAEPAHAGPAAVPTDAVPTSIAPGPTSTAPGPTSIAPELTAPQLAVAEPPLVPTDPTADPVLEPEPTVSADDLAEALATIDIHAIPIEPPLETDQMRLF